MADDDELFIINQTGVDNPTNLVDPSLQLPHHILHSIFSYLSFHVRRVSKNWHHNTPSLLALHFSEFFFHQNIQVNTCPITSFGIQYNLLSTLGKTSCSMLKKEYCTFNLLVTVIIMSTI
ncbi:hypothetical protein RDI58_009229 [Solanum bulbocastanum]|uniref:F-box domain-containing protein n=1 Tax=Solanum bulbocastanum TaxID=147425 RepID=A0AAN8YJA0_SOLBU